MFCKFYLLNLFIDLGYSPKSNNEHAYDISFLYSNLKKRHSITVVLVFHQRIGKLSHQKNGRDGKIFGSARPGVSTAKSWIQHCCQQNLVSNPCQTKGFKRRLCTKLTISSYKFLKQLPFLMIVSIMTGFT